MKEHQVDVIISDYEMPEINGIDFLKKVRDSGNSIPFIIFTGKGREEVVIQALNAGADFYIQKGGEPKSQFAELINKVHYTVTRRKAERDLELKNREWDGIFEGIAQSALLLTPEQKIMAANRATYDLLGLDAGEVTGRECYILFHQEYCPIDGCPVTRVLKTKKDETGEIFCPNLNKTFLISCTPVLDNRGEVERIIHLAADITENKKGEEVKSHLLKFQEEMLETDAVWIDTLDIHGAITFWNRGAEKISGFRRDEVLGKTLIWEQLYPDPDYRREIQDKAIAIIFRKEQVNDFETRIRSRSGQSKVISWYSHALTGDDNTIIGSIAIGTDITARTRAEIDLSFKNDELSVANEELLVASDELKKQCHLLQVNQEALQISQERLSLALEGSGDGLLDWNVHTGKTYLSPRFYTMLGYEPGEFASDYENWHGLIHPDDVPEADAQLLQHFEFQTGQYQAEFRMLAHDGKWRWILAKGKVVERDFQGGVIRVVGTLSNITSLKEKSEEIHQYADIIRNMQTGLYVFRLNNPDDDRSLQLIRTNPASTSVLGLYPDDIIGKNIDDIFPALRKSGIPGIFADVIRNGIVRELPDLESFYDNLPHCSYSVKAVPIPGNCVAVIIDDISARKEKEREIAESEEKYRVLIESANEMIFVLQDGRLCFGNQRFQNFLTDYGIENGQISLFDLVYDEDRDLAQRYADLQSCSDPNPARCEFRIMVGKGVVRWVEITTVGFTWKGKPALLSFAYDVTDRILDHLALEQANKKLNLLTSITRHDILNQLTSLNGFLDLVNEGEGDILHHLVRIRTASEIIRAQIEYTRLYNELGSFKPAWYFLGSIISEQISAFESSGVLIESDTDNLWIFADPMIGKVFYNLIDNALKYGEKITKIVFSWKEVKDCLIITCEDDGMGISREMKNKIFLRGVGKNTGFGLFLAREILAITGIGIEETGDEGVGARFEIIVPQGRYRISDSSG
jgi:PAS domain S-box-containing protein